MSEQPQIRFDDGAAYETYMGVWSRQVGEDFLSWLAPTVRPVMDRCRLRQWRVYGFAGGACEPLVHSRR